MLINCEAFLPSKEGLDYSNCFGKWINNNNNNARYEFNIKKLIIIQKWFKKIILSNNLKKILIQIIPIYYHPECKGVYIHKKQMLVDLQ